MVIASLDTVASGFWVIGGFLGIIVAVAFVYTYFKANVKKNTTELTDETIKNYQDLVGSLEKKNDYLTRKVAEMGKKLDRVIERNIKLEAQVEAFQNFPHEISTHMEKTNEALSRIAEKLEAKPVTITTHVEKV